MSPTPQTAPLRTMLVGAGKMGRNHLRLVAEDSRFDLRLIVDPSPTLQLPATLVGAARVVSRLEDAKNEPVDCAIVAAPTQAHFEICQTLLPTCRRVLLEKPVAATLRESRALQRLASDLGVDLWVGHVERFNPAIRKAQEVAARGWIGELIHLATTRVGGYPADIRASENVLLDLAVHDLDILSLIMGRLEVVASVCHSTWYPDVYDAADILVRDPQGRSAVVHVNWVTHTKVRSLRITGSRGVCFVDNILQTCSLSGGNLLERESPDSFTFAQLVDAYKNADRVEFGVHKIEPLKAQLDHFWRAVRGLDHGLCPLEDAVTAVALAEDAMSRAVSGVVRSKGQRGAGSQ